MHTNQHHPSLEERIHGSDRFNGNDLDEVIHTLVRDLEMVRDPATTRMRANSTKNASLLKSSQWDC